MLRKFGSTINVATWKTRKNFELIGTIITLLLEEKTITVKHDI